MIISFFLLFDGVLITLVKSEYTTRVWRLLVRAHYDIQYGTRFNSEGRSCFAHGVCVNRYKQNFEILESFFEIFEESWSANVNVLSTFIFNPWKTDGSRRTWQTTNAESFRSAVQFPFYSNFKKELRIHFYACFLNACNFIYIKLHIYTIARIDE